MLLFWSAYKSHNKNCIYWGLFLGHEIFPKIIFAPPQCLWSRPLPSSWRFQWNDKMFLKITTIGKNNKTKNKKEWVTLGWPWSEGRNPSMELSSCSHHWLAEKANCQKRGLIEINRIMQGFHENTFERAMWERCCRRIRFSAWNLRILRSPQ